MTTSNITITAGEVVLTGKQKKDGAAKDLRFNKIIFTKSEETALDNTTSELKAIKRIENGQLIIEKNGVRYNVTGQVIK